MPLSRYLHFFPWPDDLTQNLAYSSRTGATMLLPAEILADITNNNLDTEDEAVLRKLGFFVDDPEIEKIETTELVRQLNVLRTSVNISIILTMQCNFRCRYCYEGNRKGPDTMGRETAARLVEYVQETLPPDTERLTLDFYGGEPLLAVERMEEIAAPLREFADSQGIKFEFTLVTNGSLLTRKMVEHLKLSGLKRAKVTIDGPPEIHNFYRPYKGGNPSFETILDNVRETCDLIGIGLSGNFTRDNFRGFPKFFSHLEKWGLTPEKIPRLNFSPVIQSGDEFAPGFCGGCASVNEGWLAEAVPLLRGEILARGFKAGELKVSLCMVDVDNSCVVHFDGSIYKCVAMIGHRDYSCGNIWSGKKDCAEIYHQDHWREVAECRECSYLPLCFGGCRYMAFQRHGTMARVDCQKDYYDSVLESLIKQDLNFAGND